MAETITDEWKRWYARAQEALMAERRINEAVREQATKAQAAIAERDAALAKIQDAGQALLNYRRRNTFNFQLEKADDYLERLDIALSDAPDSARRLLDAARLCAEVADEEQDALCSGISLSPNAHDALMQKVNVALATARAAGLLRKEEQT